MRKYLVFFAIWAVSAFGVFALYHKTIPFIQHIDLKLKDTRFRVRGKVQPTAEVAVIAIDNKSIKEIGRWPWSREIFGELINGLASYGAKVTALDVVFAEPQTVSADRALADSIKSAGNVIMGYFFRNDRQELPEGAQEQVASAKIKLIKIDEGVNSIPVTEYASLDPNIPELGRGARDFGFFNQLADSDSDGLFRRTPLILLFQGDIYPSLALKTLQYYLGGEPLVDVANFGVRGISIGKWQIPVNEHGELTLNYYGPTGSFKTVSAVDVIRKRLPRNVLKDKVALVGATEVGIYDLRATPFDPALPGIEIHATAVANAIEEKFLLRDSRTLAIEILAIFLFPLLLAVLLCRAPNTITGLFLFTLTAGFFACFNYILFKSYLLDTSVLYPLMALSFTSIGSETYRNLVVEKKGRYLKKAFSNYVSAELVGQILKNPDSLKLGGEKREITILFSDIRGFTTLSESLSPEELVSLLNRYLSPMTRIVMEEKGTLDKYIGDAIMALYNAPLDVADHATHACLSAVKMLKHLDELNREFATQGLHTIDIGIGINTGNAVVGNMGADMRFDYTAIGDNVNLASRLEGLNKLYGTRILVSAATMELVQNPEIHFREIDLVKVKGKEQPIAIYEIVSAPSDTIDKFTSALQLYRNRQFHAALEIFTALLDSSNDSPSRLYQERCQEFLTTPPPENWDGVFTAKTK